MNNTFLIVAIVVIVWAVLFVIMMSFNKKRQAKANEFNNENRDRAIVHLYGKDLKIDGNDISHFDTTTGESLEKVVALDAGKHSFEGVFETTAVSAAGKNLQFEVDLQSGRIYSAGIYDYSPEDRERYVKEYGSKVEDILVMPLSLYKESDYARGCLVVTCDK